MKIHVGCCGPAGLPLEKYPERFGVMEVQSTFYRLPSLKTANSWLQQVKEGFYFTAKAFQGITHPITSPTWRKAGSQRPMERVENYGHLKPTKENFECWRRTMEVCRALQARVCVVQLPPSFTCEEENEKNIVEFFSSVEKPMKVAIEVRHPSWDKEPSVLNRVLERVDAIHIVDPLMAKPVSKSDVGYYRLHGLSKRRDYRYQYHPQELLQLRDEIRRIGCSESYVMFNNIPMKEDALRFKGLIEKNALAPLEGDSLEERLRMILRGFEFPIKAKVLKVKRGYRLIEVRGEILTLAEMVEQIKRKDFESFSDLLKSFEGANWP